MKGLILLSEITKEQQQRALDDLSYIKQLTSENRKYAAEVSPYLILWGVIWVIGYGAEALQLYAVLSWLWPVLGGVGFVINLFIIMKQTKSNPFPKVVARQFTVLICCFAYIVLIFVLFIALGLLQLEPSHYGLFIILLVSILYMLFGILLGKEIFLIGLWLGVLAAMTGIWFMPFASYIFCICGGGSLIATGLLLRRWR